MTVDPATPEMRDLAARMVAHEAMIGDSAAIGIYPAFRVWEKLLAPLTALAGSAGSRSLLARALVIARREAPVLNDVRVTAEGSLEEGVVQSQANGGRSPETAQEDNEQSADGRILLVAELLGLLHLFIGQAITLRLIRDIWPDAPIHGTEFQRTNTHER